MIIANADLDPALLGPLPPNVEVHTHIPQMAVLRQASAFVTHGGIGSMADALWTAIEDVVADPTVRERLAWVRGEIDAAGGAETAADAIEKVLANVSG